MMSGGQLCIKDTATGSEGNQTDKHSHGKKRRGRKKKKEIEGGKTMGSEGGKQELEFDMVKKTRVTGRFRETVT